MVLLTTVMSYTSIFIVLVNLSIVSAQFDVGFEMWFETSLRETENNPIRFERPLPRWLRGTLVRNGLGRFEVGHRNFSHAFDAFGKLSSWKFPGNGSAFFSTKFIQSDFYNMSVIKNTIYPYLLFDTVIPPYSFSEKIEAMERRMGNMNVNIYQLKDSKRGKYEYVILNDCWNLYEVEPLTLKTLQPITPEIPQKSLEFFRLLSSAHPLREPGTNNYLDFLTSLNLLPGAKNRIQFVRIKSAFAREQIAELEIDRIPYMHSFSVTNNYAILFVMPFTMNLEKLTSTLVALDSLEWSNTDPTVVYIINLKSGKVKQMQTENGFSMHHINSFEMDKSKIIVDIPVYNSPDPIKSFKMAILRNKTIRNKFNILARLTRYIIDLESNNITVKPYFSKDIVPVASRIDMPSINEKYRYRHYCYAYGRSQKIDDLTFGRVALAKKDLCGNTTDLVWYIRNHYPEEAWFVPFPNSTREDDGYLLTPVFDGEKKQSYFAIIDARTMKTVNSASLPITNPMSTHGRFFYDVY